LVGIRHGGLKDRILTASSAARDFNDSRKSMEDEVYTEIDTTIEKLESNIVDNVEEITKPLFILFDYFELSRSVLEDIVNKFIQGRVS
jgi:flagellar biosynthesis/type III secretory pathway protein FliH